MKDMNMQETEYINVYGARVHNFIFLTQIL